jgi:formylglycine-generating enzyme required for sulfatase activity
VEDWCADLYQKGGPVSLGDRVVRPLVAGEPDLGPSMRRAWRGGSWNGSARLARSAFRYGAEPSTRLALLGFRAARSFP